MKYKSQFNEVIIAGIKNEKDKYLLETLEYLHFFIVNLEIGYSSSSKKLSWKKVDKSINMMKTILFDEWDNTNYERINTNYFDQHYFIQFIEYLYDEQSWEHNSYYILTRVMSEMFLYFFPDEIVQKLDLPLSLLLKINMKMSIRVEWNISNSIEEDIERKLKDSDFLDECDTASIIRLSLKDKDKIKNFTIKKRRLLTYYEIIEMMENVIKFWKKILSRSNYKIPSNKRYTDEMFEYTTEKIKEGYRRDAAYELTLISFDEDPLKYESYGKRYLDGLNGGNKLPKKRK